MDERAGDGHGPAMAGGRTMAPDLPPGLRLYQVDAFADEPLRGNPAAVVPLEAWLPDELMQAVAAENNLSETAFFVPTGPGRYELRWFTPAAEVDLCGHATLAAGFVLFERLGEEGETVTFESRSGPLGVRRHRDGGLVLDFPARPGQPCVPPPDLVSALGARPLEALRASRDYMAVFASEREVRALRPDFARLETLDLPGVIVTAPGEEVDFVSRFFCPALGIPEDPVTGSSHCTLVPYWSRRLGRPTLRARQVSRRGGELLCADRGERVEIAGHAALYLEGVIRPGRDGLP